MRSKSCALLAFPAILALAANADARMIRHRSRSDCNRTSITEKDIRSFNQVDGDLYRGAHPHCSGYEKLSALGIRTIIDLQGTPERKARDCEEKNQTGKFRFQFISFKISLFQTTFTGVSDKQLDRLFSIIAQAPKPIFIGCKFGEDRTGLVVALYRMKRGEMTYAEARREALYYGFEPNLCGLNQTFKRFRDPQKLAALPFPYPSSPPTSVCFPNPAAPNSHQVGIQNDR
jgi:protein tyrosine/serine phosphatase